MKNLVVSLNIILLLVVGYLLSLGGPNSPVQYLAIAFLLVSPLVTLYYLYLSESEGDSLLSLWLKVRKKKLKDELEDSD
tara:strand:+ start:4394 stop:4630 length:237 start_codon:yes stop_codon:yes gene_type:complete